MPAPQTRVAMKDVAKAAGVHVTTVSLALRNSPQLPAATRERIRALAEQMGYRVNPLLAALVQQRRTARSGKFQGALGFVTRSINRRGGLRHNPYLGRMYAAAAEHAESLGFKLDHFESLDYEHNWARMEKAFHARNIRGLFFPPSQAPEGDVIDLHWEHFSCATLSTNLRVPMDHIDTDHFGASLEAARVCRERGYSRLGYATLLSSDIASGGRWRGGHLSYLLAQSDLAHLPALVAADDDFDEAFVRWYRRHRPDVVISNNLTLSRYLPLLEKLDVSVPRDVATVSINLYASTGSQSGLCVCVEDSARRTIDQIVTRLYRNQLGLPERPAIVLTPPVWHEGATLPARP